MAIKILDTSYYYEGYNFCLTAAKICKPLQYSTIQNTTL